MRLPFEHANLVVATVGLDANETAEPMALVGRKQRGPYAGFVVFPGGKVDDGMESRREAAAREFREETGLTVAPDSLRLAGRIMLYGSRLGFIDIMHVDLAEPTMPMASEEFVPEWREILSNDQFYAGMPQDVRFWFTEIFTTKSFRAHAVWDGVNLASLRITGHTKEGNSLYDYNRAYNFG